MSLYIMRHCLTNNNKNKIFSGQMDIDIITNDIDITLLSNSPKPIKIYSSSLKRCVDTLNLYKDKIKISNVYFLDELKERNYGIFEGRLKKEIHIKYPQFFNEKKFIYRKNSTFR